MGNLWESFCVVNQKKKTFDELEHEYNYLPLQTCYHCGPEEPLGSKLHSKVTGHILHVLLYFICLRAGANGPPSLQEEASWTVMM